VLSNFFVIEFLISSLVTSIFPYWVWAIKKLMSSKHEWFSS